MRKSAQTAKRCRQIEFYEIFVAVNGTATTPVASGIDSRAIASVTDLGTGNYRINLKDKSPQALEVGGIVLSTASRIGRVTAKTESSVTLQFSNLSGAAADADFSLTIQWLGTKHRF
jgi:hypothetical protein